MQTSMEYSRPAFVSMLPGGKQEFPKDEKGEAYRTRLAREQAKKEGRVLTRRIPKEEVL
jgi:hypothetical protein